MKKSFILIELLVIKTCQTGVLPLYYLKKMVKNGEITQGHARALLALEKTADIIAVAEQIVHDGLNVRQVEKLVSELKKNPKTKPTKKTDKNVEAYIKNLAADLTSRLGAKVSIKHGEKKGKIEIEYYGSTDLENILKKIK